MIIIQVTGEQLSSMMQEAVRQGIADYSKLLSASKESDRWLSAEELRDYIPGRPSITTIYGYVQRRQIPFKRVANKRLAFLKSEIDAWLQSQHRKTQSELSATAEQYLSSTRKRK